MKFVILAVLALAISSEASYPLAEPVVPAVTYGLPEEHKPVVVASHAVEVAPLVTVQESKPVAAVSYDYSIVHPAPVLRYGASYPAPLPTTPIVYPHSYALPQHIVKPISYYGYPSYRYGYSGLLDHQLVYNAAPSVGLVSSRVVTSLPEEHKIVVPHSVYGVPH